MTRSASREKFERLGPTLADDRAPSGTREVVSLTLGPDLSAAKAISAVLSLRRRHVPTLKAKRSVEAAIARRTVVLVAPMVEDLRKLAEELARSGFSISVSTTKAVDVRRIRDRLGMTREEFALSFGLDVDAVRNWEHGRREPDLAAKSYLTVIDREPEVARAALAVPVL